MHESVTVERVMEILEGGSYGVGICLACGEDTDGVEPDACGYKCEACGARKVYGAEEVLMTIAA